MKCPICNKTFSEGDSGVVMPFCSSRCKMIDAKRWLSEEYSILGKSVPSLEELEEKAAYWEQSSTPSPENN